MKDTWREGSAEDDAPSSRVGLSVISGTGLTLWSSGGEVETRREGEMLVPHGRPAIVGRSEGRPIEYLDPAYVPTTLVPGTNQTVLTNGGQGDDRMVSRGHFMLQAIAGGVLFVNGVPRAGGGVRAPLNGTVLLSPAHRSLAPGEQYFIEAGSAILLRLPNRSEVRLEAR